METRFPTCPIWPPKTLQLLGLPLQKMVTALCKAFKMEADGGVAQRVNHPRFSGDVSTLECRLRLFISPEGVDWNEAGSKHSVAMHVDGTRGRAVSRDHGRGCKR